MLLNLGAAIICSLRYLLYHNGVGSFYGYHVCMLSTNSGVEQLIHKGSFVAAYPLHDVSQCTSVCEDSMCTGSGADRSM